MRPIALIAGVSLLGLGLAVGIAPASSQVVVNGEERAQVSQGWETLFWSARDASGTMICDHAIADQHEREFWAKYRRRVSTMERLIEQRFGRAALNEDRIVTVPCRSFTNWDRQSRGYRKRFLSDLSNLETMLGIRQQKGQ